MKKINVFAITVFVTLFGLAGCIDIFQPPASKAPSSPEPGKGYVRLQFGSAAGRTLLPNYTFAAYKFTFNPVETSGEKKVISVPEDAYLLEVGNWTLDVEVYSDTEAQTLVATANNIALTVNGGESVTVEVLLEFASIDQSGGGIFTYTVTNNSGITPNQTEIILKRLDTADQADYYYHDPASPVEGCTVPAGYYLVTVRLEKDPILSLGYSEFHQLTRVTGAERAVWSDIVHIYPGQTTDLAHTFGPNDFFSGIENIWLFGHMTGWDLGDLSNKNMTKEADGTFSWKGEVMTDECYFRFSLTDTHEWDGGDSNMKLGAWFIPENTGTSAVIGNEGNAMNFLPLNHNDTVAVEKTWKLDDVGYYEITLDPVEWKFHIEKPVLVTGIKIPPQHERLFKGATHAFIASLEGYNNDGEQSSVVWTVSGNHSSDTAFGTGANFNRLTIAEDEEAVTLSVTARYGEFSDTMSSIRIIDSDNFGPVNIVLVIEDQGGSLTLSGGIPSSPPVIYKTGGTAGEDRVTFSVGNFNAGYVYTWKVDDRPGIEEASLTLNAVDYAVGYHLVRLTVKIGNFFWSMPNELGFTVAAVKN